METNQPINVFLSAHRVRSKIFLLLYVSLVIRFVKNVTPLLIDVPFVIRVSPNNPASYTKPLVFSSVQPWNTFQIKIRTMIKYALYAILPVNHGNIILKWTFLIFINLWISIFLFKVLVRSAINVKVAYRSYFYSKTVATMIVLTFISLTIIQGNVYNVKIQIVLNVQTLTKTHAKLVKMDIF